MKKILLATSILAATTGYAAAEVALTGDARMGVVYDGEDVQFSQRARVRFNLSGQTDTGLEFGATFRADQANGSASGGAFGSSDDSKRGTVWISGAFGKLSMGDVNSAAEEAFGDLTAIGFSGLDDLTDIPYISGDGSATLDQGPGALYSYATGAFEFHLGMTDGTLPYGEEDAVVGNSVDATYSVAAAYSADTFKVGLGYLDNGDNNYVRNAGDPEDEYTAVYGGSQWILYGSTELSGFGLKAYYSSFDDLALDKSYGLTVDYTFGDTTITGFARRDEYITAAAQDDADTFGIGAAYDLGGGASLNGGVVDSDLFGTDGETVADFGVKLRF
ncbi:porin [Falsirhodobacter xinxiangensis]|uniref:porin n=1 Tax=Falsirhodobacter xinxiangensis TaxID=2530049 RepID=UPI00145B8495|nr:porin [Rhodobacter xinxiangensis]